MRGIKQHIIFLAFFCLAFSAKAHDYYVAIYDVQLSRDGQSLQISAKLIAHDVEEAIARANHPFLNMGSKNEYPKTDSILHLYMSQKLQFDINGKRAQFNYVGHELELDEDLWIYLEIPLEEPINELYVYNGVLIENFEGQQNIMHLKIGEYTKTITFTKDLIEQTHIL